MLTIKKVLCVICLGLMGILSIFAQSKNEFQSHFQMPDNIKPGDYLEKTIILKVKPEYAGVCSLNAIEHRIFNSI